MANNSDPATTEDVKNLIKEYRKATGTFGKLIDSLHDYGDDAADEWDKVLKNDRDSRRQDRDRDKRIKKNEKEDRHQRVENSTRSFVKSFKSLEGSSDSAATAITGMSKVVLGGAVGAVTEGLLHWATNLTSTYRDLTSVGQGFSGGLIAMSQAAAQSGLSLEKYAQLITKNSDLAATYKRSGQSLGDWTKTVRAATYENGMYGYSVDGLNDLTMEYMRRQTLFGRQDKMSKEEAVDSVKVLAQQTTGLAGLFGKSRDEITKTASDAMHQGTFIAMMLERTGNQFQSSNQKIQAGVTSMAALPGETGKLLSKMTADAVSWGGQAEGGETAQQYVDAGLGGIVTLIDQYSKDMKDPNKDQDQVMADFTKAQKKVFTDNIETLKTQARSGNRMAQMFLEHADEIQVVTADQIKKQREEAVVKNAFTKQMTNLEGKWGDMLGIIRNAALPVLGAFVDRVAGFIDRFAALGGVDYLEGAMTSFGTWIDSFLKTSKDDSNGFLDSLVAMARSLADFPKFMQNLSVGNLLISGVKALLNPTVLEIVASIGGIIAAIAMFKKSFNMLGEGFAKKLFGKATNVNEMIVHARNVVVHGGSSGGGLGGALGGGGEGPREGGGSPRKGWRGMLDRVKGSRYGRFSGGIMGLIGAGVELNDMAEGMKGNEAPEPSEPKVEEAAKPTVLEKVAPVESSVSKVGGVEGAIGSDVGKAVATVAEEPKWLGMLKGFGKGIGHFGAVAGKLDLVIGGIKASGEVAEVIRGKKSMGAALKGALYDVLPSIGGLAGGAIGGLGGAFAGSVIPGPGTVLGELAGNVGGYMAGEALTDKALSWIFGPKSDGTNLPASMKDQSQESLHVQLGDDINTLAKMKDSDPNKDALIKKIDELKEVISKQSEAASAADKAKIAIQKRQYSALKDSFRPDPRS